ncbi:unannotated protein [freshwater metagenome]|uniref:Unannotated protein n=1 Tax=freshwater metagenome TaxID=449393 RepID=A0A6J6B734_9ZZZZ|nr:ABC transporter permease subunit [Actinomycetota bacterium]
MKQLSKTQRLVAIAVLSFLLWELAALVVRSNSFPHSWSVLGNFASLITEVSFWKDLTLTLWISLLGFLIGTASALAIGICIGLSRDAELASRATLNFVRVIPSVVMLPLLIASIGSSARTAVILSAFVVTFTFVTYVVRGIADTEKQLIEASKLMQLPRMVQVLFLYLPSTVSLLGTGMRLCASRAFGTVVAAGIVAGTPGLGSRLYLAQANADTNRVFSYVFVMGITGVLIYSSFTIVEKRLFKWKVSV